MKNRKTPRVHAGAFGVPIHVKKYQVDEVNVIECQFLNPVNPAQSCKSCSIL